MATAGSISEASESPLKKSKLKDEDVESLRDEVEEQCGDYVSEDVEFLSDEDEEDDEDDASECDSESEDDLDPKIREDYRLYKKQFRETEGFGITVNLGMHILGAIIPLDLNNKECKRLKMMKECIPAVINYYNSKQNAQLQLEEILAATFHVCAGNMFYITFTAKNSSSEETKTYQAEVYYGLGTEPPIEVEFVRVKPEKELSQA